MQIFTVKMVMCLRGAEGFTVRQATCLRLSQHHVLKPG